MIMKLAIRHNSLHNRVKKREKVKRTKPDGVGYSIESRYDWIEKDINNPQKKELGQWMQLYIVIDGVEYKDCVILEPIQWSKHNNRLYTYFDKQKIYAHEIAWYLEHGAMPGKLRFKDGNTMNYSIHNLEERGSTKTYQAQVRVGDKIKCLGSYSTKEAAIEAQNAFKALRKMGLV